MGQSQVPATVELIFTVSNMIYEILSGKGRGSKMECRKFQRGIGKKYCAAEALQSELYPPKQRPKP